MDIKGNFTDIVRCIAQDCGHEADIDEKESELLLCAECAKPLDLPNESHIVLDNDF